ncbi:hypothetical protein OSTOST_05949, partial [Ostertagia ostertagi]
MNFNHSTSGKLDFPIVFPAAYFFEITLPFKVAYTIECLSIIFATPALIKFFRALDKSAIFHRNLIYVTKFHYCAFYLLLPSRMALLLYTLGFVSLPEDAQFTSVFFAVCFVNIFCKCVPSFAPPCMLLERLFASHYISDYEAKSRTWVAASAVLTSFALSSFFASAAVFGNNLLCDHQIPKPKAQDLFIIVITKNFREKYFF